jgi:hypothetical protein
MSSVTSFRSHWSAGVSPASHAHNLSFRTPDYCGVLHRVFVVGTLALTSPVTVLGLLIGVILITVGYRLEERHRDVLSPEEDETDDEFDEEYASFDESDMEDYERDDEY